MCWRSSRQPWWHLGGCFCRWQSLFVRWFAQLLHAWLSASAEAGVVVQASFAVFWFFGAQLAQDMCSTGAFSQRSAFGVFVAKAAPQLHFMRNVMQMLCCGSISSCRYCTERACMRCLHVMAVGCSSAGTGGSVLRYEGGVNCIKPVQGCIVRGQLHNWC